MENSRVCKAIAAFVIVALVSVLLLVTSVTSPSVAIEKMKPEDLVARHLESIGPTKERTSIKTRIIAGTSLVVFRTAPLGQATGRAVLASDGPKSLIGMSFPSSVYPREQLGFNGNSFLASFVTPGVRSSLGSFLMTHDLVFKQGLMGGTLSTAWPLLDMTTRNPHLEYTGIKKIENRTLHELKYLPRGGSDLQISLFFDRDTFQHVRTHYERVIPASIGTRSYANVEERESRYKMVEEFSEFRSESGLTLPHNYTIMLTVDTQSGTFVADWTLHLTQFTFNELIDPNSFNVGAD